MDRRQTQQNVNEKTGAQPSSRISRLAQPRKYSATPHSLNRNRSSSHENVSHYNRPIAKRSRSNSAAPNVPSETPIRPRPHYARSLSSLFTPASTNKNTAATNRGSTSTNRNIKRCDSEQVGRILEVLRNHFGPTFLSGGLQSMSAKQFVEIIRFFAQSITGGKVVVRDNNVDDVKLFADFMEYPHQINKSSFKAPTVSIAYDRNVEFLDWLCDFIVTDDTDVADEIEYKEVEAECLIDQQFAASFVGDLKNGFAIWSDETAEFDGWKLKWIRKMIHTRTGLDDIDASTGQIQNDYAILETKEASFGNESLLQTQQKKHDDLKKEVAKLKENCQEKAIDIRESSEELKVLASTNNELKRSVKEMKETIKTQRMSADDRRTHIDDLNQKTVVRDEKRVFVQTLQTIFDDHQVKIARLKKQKTIKVHAINAVVQKLFQIGIKFGDLTIDQLSISEADTESEIKAKLHQFTQVKEIINSRRADIHASVNETQSELSSISNELFVKENEISSLKKQLHSLEVRVRKVEQEIVDTQYDSELQQQQLQVSLDKTTEEIQNIQAKMAIKQQTLESLKAENKAIYEGIKEKSDAILQAKLKRQARQEAAIAELEELAEELKNAVKNLN